MVADANAPAAPEPAAATEPAPDPDFEKWAALEEELKPAEPAEPEPPQPVDGKPEPEPQPREHVPYGEHENVQKALREQREQNRQMQDRLAQLVERVAVSRAQPQPQPQPQFQIPDVNEDPIGHFAAVNQILAARLEQMERGSSQTQQYLQTQASENQFWGMVVQSENQLRSTVPQVTQADGTKVSDYDLACAHLERTRVGELELMFPDNSAGALDYARRNGYPDAKALREQMLNNDRLLVAQQAMQLGISPAEFYYGLAKQRGYKTQADQTRGKTQIAATRAGQRASVSISGSNSGRKSSDEISMIDLADLYISDPVEADKQWEAMKKAGKLG